ncbi:RNA ligase family protein [Streptomyces sp. bgisy153]|uniref:RNA ligase family protein n=1 Tax=Streptomyces sp. bgisy153 TaxID=3413793 RepID=UPI003D74D81B
MHEFREWPKTKRLFRDIVVTEKIDGTNSAVHITAVPHIPALGDFPPGAYSLVVDGIRYVVSAQSRRRIITPGKTTDNYGFAGWVYDNAEALVRLLGEGLHFGEWWGRGIQRGYDLAGRAFSLFNTERYANVHESVGEFGGVPVTVGPVPVLYDGVFSEERITGELEVLRKYGSVAAPGFPNPEGICVYHSQSRNVYKVTLDNNDAGKWEAAA